MGLQPVPGPLAPLLKGLEAPDDVEFSEQRQVFPAAGEVGFFQIDKSRLKHRRFDGSWSREIVREVFERGDAVGVLLFNRNSQSVIVVEQFRLPIVGRGGHKGWMLETIAGVVQPKERPIDTAIRETFEETGYTITNPHPIAEFFSSPGGSSERIFLFFKEVQDRDKTGIGGGVSDEDIRPVQIPVSELAERLRRQEFVDPKLLIAFYYLQARLGLRIDTDERLGQNTPKPTYQWRRGNHIFKLGFKTGEILDVEDVDIWLNPENRYMQPMRVFDEGLSAHIRWGVARKYRNNEVAEDTLASELNVRMGSRLVARHMEIVETDPGELRRRNRVRRLIHLPIAGALGADMAKEGVAVDRKLIRPYVAHALREAHEGESSNERRMARMRDWLRGNRGPCTSVLIPMIGTGQGRLLPHASAAEIIAGIDDFLDTHHTVTHLRDFYLLVLYDSELSACRDELAQHGKFEKV